LPSGKWCVTHIQHEGISQFYDIPIISLRNMYLHDALRDASVIREMFVIKDPEPKEDLSDVDLRHVSGVTLGDAGEVLQGSSCTSSSHGPRFSRITTVAVAHSRPAHQSSYLRGQPHGYMGYISKSREHTDISSARMVIARWANSSTHTSLGRSVNSTGRWEREIARRICSK
jgi:hypothetical protein